MTPADQLRQLRQNTGLSQARFAALYEIPRRTYEDWERGVATPPPYVVNLLRAAVERDTDTKED